MNFEYFISRGAILLGFFTFGVAMAQSIDFLFDYWDFLTSISTLGILVVAIKARNDYKSVKHHDLQIETLNSTVIKNSQEVCLKLATNIRLLLDTLNEIDNLEVYKNTQDVFDSILKNQNIYLGKFNEEYTRFLEIKRRISILKNKKNLEQYCSKLHKTFKDFKYLFSLLLYEAEVKNNTHEKILVIQERLHKYNSNEDQPHLELISTLNKPQYRDKEISNIISLGKNIEVEAFNILESLIESED